MSQHLPPTSVNPVAPIQVPPGMFHISLIYERLATAWQANYRIRMIMTGSRDWPQDGQYRAIIEDLIMRLVPGSTVVHGGAPGADWLAQVCADQLTAKGHQILTEQHKADWSRFGRSAGPRRNMLMVKRGADCCVGFRLQGAENKGTFDCLMKAAQAGIPTFVCC